MSIHEPAIIARRLAAALGVPRASVPEVSYGALPDVSDETLADAVAVVLVGAPEEPTSAALRACTDAARRRGAAVIALEAFGYVLGPTGEPGEAPIVVASWHDDQRVVALLSAGPHSLFLDEEVEALPWSEARPPARVCVVSFEAAGLTGGGIGTASTALAETLAEAGHEVVVLFTGWQEADATPVNETCVEQYAATGIRLEFARVLGTNPVFSPYFPVRTAYEVFAWLTEQPRFDVVHVPENMGHGYFAQLAKRHGTHFGDTTFVVGTHGPSRWAAEANGRLLAREDLLVNDFLEQASLAMADVVLGPSRYLHRYLRERGWKMPERVHVQPYGLASAVRRVAPAAGSSPNGSRELVFFGRLETRKGVATLCDALDDLAARAAPPDFDLTFLGPVDDVLGRAADRYIADRATAWPWSWRIVADADRQTAAEHLARPGVIAVMPSLVDNAPNTVSEAVALGVPLVASRAGGTVELIAPDQRDGRTFGPAPGGPVLPAPPHQKPIPLDAQELASLLERTLAGQLEPIRPAWSRDAVARAYDVWHRAVRSAAMAQPHPEAAPDASPASITACVVDCHDAEMLATQLSALEGEQIPAVVSEGPGGASRNAAVAASEGDWIAFVSPVDVPAPGFARMLRQVVARTTADVLACVVLDGRDGAKNGRDHRSSFVPVGGPPLAGVSHLAFSAGVYVIRRAVLAELGGFAVDARADEADHELLNRVLASGRHVEVIPSPLAVKRRGDRWTRFSQWPHLDVDPPYDADQLLRTLRPLVQIGGAAPDMLGLLVGKQEERVRMAALLEEVQAAYEKRISGYRSWVDALEANLGEHREWVNALEETVADLRKHAPPGPGDDNRRRAGRARRSLSRIVHGLRRTTD